LPQRECREVAPRSYPQSLVLRLAFWAHAFYRYIPPNQRARPHEFIAPRCDDSYSGCPLDDLNIYTKLGAA
jgi:hypothetical protein